MMHKLYDAQTFRENKVRWLVNQKVSFMETTFVRLESLTYFSLTPISLFGSDYAGLGTLELVIQGCSWILGDLCRFIS